MKSPQRKRKKPGHEIDADRTSIPATIYAQGALDGACFLYSVANAFQTLTGQRIGKDTRLTVRWNRAILNLPHPTDYLLCDVGSVRYSIGDTNFTPNLDDASPCPELVNQRPSASSYGVPHGDWSLFLLAARILIYELSTPSPRARPTLEVEYVPPRVCSTPRHLARVVTPSAVVIIPVTKTDNQSDIDHWLCVSGASRHSVELQCSWIMLNRKRRRDYAYVEQRGYQGRLFNDWLTEENLTDEDVISGPVLRVSRRG